MEIHVFDSILQLVSQIIKVSVSGPTGDDQNKVKSPLYQGFANTPVLCIRVSVLRDLHWLPLLISRFPSITIVYFTFPTGPWFES